MLPKFRVWDEKEKRMLYPDLGDYTMEIDEYGVHVLGNHNQVISVDEDESVMCSTGVLDRESVEVFEGDIIRTQSPIIDENRPEPAGVVEYWKGRASFSMVINENKDGYPLHQLIKNGMSIIVIGNKYEHSHLLEEVE
ncbi:MAG: YopX family protein [Staphylococcus rostri]|uniref:YopX family protein n=1 Tax=Staphylococcus rostri TaxID=522262 RepID=UPI0026DFC98A|nr:YopX family protein [Staphylococcus rostri]MDO5375709.1 YopX family protein [Staphylococcus rostri]